MVRDPSLKTIIDISSTTNQSINSQRTIMRRAATPFMYTNNRDGIAVVGDEADITVDKIYPLRFAIYLLTPPSGGNISVILYHSCTWEFYGKGPSKPITEPGGIPFIMFPQSNSDCSFVELIATYNRKPRYLLFRGNELRRFGQRNLSDSIAEEFWTTKAPAVIEGETVRLSKMPKLATFNGIQYYHRRAEIYVANVGPLVRIVIDSSEDFAGELVRPINPNNTFLEFGSPVTVSNSIQKATMQALAGVTDDYADHVNTMEIRQFTSELSDEVETDPESEDDDEQDDSPALLPSFCGDYSDYTDDDDASGSDSAYSDDEDERDSDRGQSDHETNPEPFEENAVHYVETRDVDEELEALAQMKRPRIEHVERFNQLYFLKFGWVDVHSFHSLRQDLGFALHYCQSCNDHRTGLFGSPAVQPDQGDQIPDISKLNIGNDQPKLVASQ
jgi:hypothetical protein